MNPVQKYIDSMFLSLPNDAEVQVLKDNINHKSMERYEKLMREGLSPEEALAKIILELEIKEAEILNNYRQQQTDNGTHKDALNIKEGRKFIDLYKKESRRIGRAIVYILISVGLISTFDVFNLAELAVLLMFLVVALSVSMLIMAGMRIDGALEDGSEVFLTDEAYFTFQNEFKTFKEKEAYRIALGVALCILSVVPLLLFDFLNNENLVEVAGVLLLLALVGLGVYQFIRYGMTYSAYERILNVGEYTKENLEYERRIEPFAGIYWLLMVLIYLTWSFITMDWHITWIMWPIAGVLWAIIALLIRVFSNE